MTMLMLIYFFIFFAVGFFQMNTSRFFYDGADTWIDELMVYSSIPMTQEEIQLNEKQYFVQNK